ncbi:MAG: helix-turn-helix domain-containing protein [Rhizobium sp.]|nr:helix-turn-helix domain-containing protein [Rhizobium sp.]MBW8321150.1 helix-turn-helix domain-containing protein [Rhizobium sp.]MBW8447904.1 helix-turn-helix domain-containing protein [Arenimonas sp.]
MKHIANTSNAEFYLSADDVMDRFTISRTTLFRWIRHRGFPSARRIGGKRYFRRAEVNAWDEAQAGAPLDKPDTALGLPIVSGVIQSYDDFVQAMRARRVDIKLSSMETEAKSGLQEGYIPKLENPGTKYGRGVGPDTLPLWLGALRVGIVLVDIPRRPRAGKMAEKPAADEEDLEMLESMKRLLDASEITQKLAAARWIFEHYQRMATGRRA